MPDERIINYDLTNQIEINRSFMPFVKNGGIFIPTNEEFKLDETIIANIKLPGNNNYETIKALIIWITPSNAIDYPKRGIGIQFLGEHANILRDKIMGQLDNTYDIGGYIFGND